MNAGESVPNAFLMREKRVDENRAKAALTSSLFSWKRFHTQRQVQAYSDGKTLYCSCNLFHASADWPAEAGVVKEGIRAAGSADKTRDPQQPELGLQTAYRSAQRVSHCQGATCCHPSNRGNEKPLTSEYTNQANNTLLLKHFHPPRQTEQIIGSSWAWGLLLQIISAHYLVKLTELWLSSPQKKQ